ncbi:MAG: CoA transferase, partial [Chloroflexota bacterium]
MLLDGYRVLDFTNEQGYLCGKILGDLGADVIKIEPPGGDPARRRGPFYHDEPDPEKSLSWWAYNINKRGITLNIECPEGQEIVRKLVPTAHCLVESFSPGYLEKLGLGYQLLSNINPGLVFVAITPFGSDGPWRDLQAPDLVGAALGGMMLWTGEPDRYPLRISVEQSYLNAGSEGSVAAIIGLYHAEATGEGQFIDVSMLESWLPAIAHPIIHWDFNKNILRREGKYRSGEGGAGIRLRNIWECRDGYVFTRIYGGKFGVKTNNGFARWMQEEGVSTMLWDKTDWDNFDIASVSQPKIDALEETLEKFLKTKSKEELYHRAVATGIQVAPIWGPRELVNNQQLQARHFWQEVESPHTAEKTLYPGYFTQVDGSPAAIRRRAPLPGEHNQ